MKRLLICLLGSFLGTSSVAYAQLNVPSEMTIIGPCRLLDTSLAGQGPGFLDNETRQIDVRGQCEIPEEATGIAVNVVVINPPARGRVHVGRGDAMELPLPALYFSRATISNMAIVALSQNPTLDQDLLVHTSFSSGARVRIIMDVMGYMAPKP